MPVHNWARVDANLFHHFHQSWTLVTCNTLNGGLLPKGFSALVEQHAAGVVPDVLALERRGYTKSGPPTGGGVATLEPKTSRIIRAKQQISAARGNRIVIRHALGKVVSVIEIVSPGNKSSVSAINNFIGKTIEFLNNGVNVMVIDLFPPSKRDPLGLHKLIWDEIESEPYDLPDDKPLTLAEYVVDQPTRAYLEYTAVGLPIPEMPAYLDGDSYVNVPLEATYQTTWESCPEDMREVVITGKLPD